MKVVKCIEHGVSFLFGTQCLDLMAEFNHLDSSYRIICLVQLLSPGDVRFVVVPRPRHYELEIVFLRLAIDVVLEEVHTNDVSSSDLSVSEEDEWLRQIVPG